MPDAAQGGSGGIPRPFEGGIGGPGGHRGEVGIPPAPLAGGATLQRRILYSIARISVVVVIMQVEISTNQYIVGLVAQ